MEQAFKYVNFVAAGAEAVGAVSQIEMSLAAVASAVWGLLFAAGIAYLEFRKPPQVTHYASFLLSFEGRGLFYVYLGTILLYGSFFRVAIGLVLALIGAGYISVGLFAPQVPAPESMRLDPEVPIDTI